MTFPCLIESFNTDQSKASVVSSTYQQEKAEFQVEYIYYREVWQPCRAIMMYTFFFWNDDFWKDAAPELGCKLMMLPRYTLPATA